MIVMPSGRRSSDSPPKPIASGTAPSIVDIVVITIGRKRLRHALSVVRVFETPGQLN
jgi:hypothetical protein